MKLKLGYQELIAKAMAQIETVPLEQAQQFLDDQNTVFVDIRDVRELERDGMIPGAIHGGAGVFAAAMKAVPAIKKSMVSASTR